MPLTKIRELADMDATLDRFIDEVERMFQWSINAKDSMGNFLPEEIRDDVMRTYQEYETARRLYQEYLDRRHGAPYSNYHTTERERAYVDAKRKIAEKHDF